MLSHEGGGEDDRCENAEDAASDQKERDEPRSVVGSTPVVIVHNGLDSVESGCEEQDAW
jgi:hypothetical protein